MDLGVYISELLGLRGEVSLPGIGYFAQVRVNGYYNEQENKFYPPAHEVSFEPQSKEDEGLAQYISDKKNISLASSKYFIDKYVAGLRQNLVSNKVEIAGLGYIYNDGPVLAFKPDNDLKAHDPAFFGFAPVNIFRPAEKLMDAPVEEKPPVSQPGEKHPEHPVEEKITDAFVPPVTEKVNAEEHTTPVEDKGEVYQSTVIEDAEEVEEDEPIYDKHRQSQQRDIWIALLLIVIIGLLILLGLYKYKPAWFEHKKTTETFIAVNPDSVKKVLSADSTKNVANTDSATNSPTAQQAVSPPNTINPVVDTFATLRYELQAGAFKGMSKADVVIKGYEKMGLHPRIIKQAPGNLYKITLGTYFNKDDAQKAKDSIIAATKVKDISLQPYLPKK